MMIEKTDLLAAPASFAVLSGCIDTPGDDGLSGSADQFDRMTEPCISQASRLTGTGGGQETTGFRRDGGTLVLLQGQGDETMEFEHDTQN